MKKLYLIDVSSLFFRAFYAIRQLNNSKGAPTNALYGFLAAVTKLLKEHKPDGFVFCYDRPESGFREELYPEYKANRSDAPEDLVKQFPYLKQLGEALNVPGFEKPGYEADDLIGCLVKLCKRQGVEVVIVSGDKDFGQLVEPGVSIYDPSKDLFIDSAGVRAKWGIDPSQVIDYLALVGDASDNVPGVKGIGPKGAQKLLSEYKSLDGIYSHVDEIKNERTRELLKKEKDMAYLSYKLCTIHCDLDLGVRLEDLAIKPVNRDLLIPLLQELEFKTLLQKLLGSSTEDQRGSSDLTAPAASIKIAEIPKDYLAEKPIKIETVTDVKALAESLIKSEVSEIWLDVTTRGIGIQIDQTVFRFEGESEKFSQWLNDSMGSRKLKISGFDTKSIAHQIKIEPSRFTSVGQDVLLEAYCTGRGGELTLNELSKKYLGSDLPEFALPEERIQAVRKISVELQKTLKKDDTLKVLNTIEQPLVPVLYKMERDGILLNCEELNSYSKELLDEIHQLEKEIIDLAGVEFNVASVKELSEVLFERLKLPTVRKTKTGYSTDSEVLEKLSSHHPIAGKILNWREVSKLRSTYVDTLPRLVDENSRVHTSFNQALAATGRLSSNHPNLQNIPTRTAKGQRIRNSFIAPLGSSLLTADYSQVELRILAHVTGDKGLIRAFEYDLDIHTATASEVFGVPLSGVTPEQRRASKAINFGIVYGMSEFGLSESLKIDRKLAAEFIERYFLRYPGVQKYMHDVVEQGKADGFVKTMFGRRRYYPELQSSNQRLRQMAERAAINMPIQGASADLIKLAMIEVDHSIGAYREGRAKMLLQVHDELIFEVKNSETEGLKEQVKAWMENTTKLNVPLKVSIGIGDSWGSAE